MFEFSGWPWPNGPVADVNMVLGLSLWWADPITDDLQNFGGFGRTRGRGEQNKGLQHACLGWKNEAGFFNLMRRILRVIG